MMFRTMVQRGTWLFVVVAAGCLELPAEYVPDGESNTTSPDGSVPDTREDAGNVVDVGADATGMVSDMGPVGPYFVGVAAGDNQACAWTSEGDLLCWGSNYLNAIDPEADAIDLPPRWVARNYRFEMADVAGYRVCGLTTEAKIICWGHNRDDVTETDDTWLTPTEFPTDFTTHRIRRIVVGPDVICSVSNESVYCWGNNDYGRVDWSGEPETPRTPAQMSIFHTVDVAGGHACGLNANDVVSCWGSNSQYRASPSRANGVVITPSGVDSQRNYQAVGAGILHTCALTKSGQVTCWGSESFNRLGPYFEDIENSPTVVDVPGVSNATAIDVANNTCALLADGSISCWGPTIDEFDPAPTPYQTPDGTAFESVAVGGQFACATSRTGVWCWGENANMRTGQPASEDPVLEPKLVPVPPL